MSHSHYLVSNDLLMPIMKGTADMTLDSYQVQLSKVKFRIISKSDDELVFDLIGVEAPIANALRRILLSEVPTVAIENVYISDNTSIIQDEVLSHRLGLIPIRCDPNKLDFVQTDDEETDSDTVVFSMDVVCPQSNGDKVDLVHSSQLLWIPQGNQEERFPEGVSVVHDDIVIAKLKAGQRINLEAHARKGVGKDHTKFSPVATASYRLLPEIKFPEPITGDRAQQLADICPMKVFDIEDIEGVPTAVVARPRDCSMCRECIRGEGWTESVRLLRKADHFIFTVESVGSISTQDIVLKAIDVLRAKARTFHALAEQTIDRDALL